MNYSTNDDAEILLSFTNDLLIKMNVSVMQVNPCFIAGELNSSEYMQFRAFSENSVALRIEINSYGVIFGLGELDEVYEWSLNDVKYRRNDYEVFLERIFFREIKVRRCAFGFNYIFVKERDSWIEYGRVFNGLFAFVMFPLSYIPFCCKETEYHPILVKG